MQRSGCEEAKILGITAACGNGRLELPVIREEKAFRDHGHSTWMNIRMSWDQKAK